MIEDNKSLLVLWLWMVAVGKSDITPFEFCEQDRRSANWLISPESFTKSLAHYGQSKTAKHSHQHPILSDTKNKHWLICIKPHYLRMTSAHNSRGTVLVTQSQRLCFQWECQMYGEDFSDPSGLRWAYRITTLQHGPSQIYIVMSYLISGAHWYGTPHRV